MKVRLGTLWIGMTALALLPSAPAAEGRCPEDVVINHRTLNFQTERGWRYELQGVIMGGKGKAKLWQTMLNHDGRNIWGDRIEDPVTTTIEHDVTLELVTDKTVLSPQKLSNDTSPGQDRDLYLIRGVGVGFNRRLLLMVASDHPRRLIQLGRCGGIWATALEPRSVYDGPAAAAK
jgi:hypothetical protein